MATATDTFILRVVAATDSIAETVTIVDNYASQSIRKGNTYAVRFNYTLGSPPETGAFAVAWTPSSLGGDISPEHPKRLYRVGRELVPAPPDYKLLGVIRGTVPSNVPSGLYTGTVTHGNAMANFTINVISPSSSAVPETIRYPGSTITSSDGDFTAALFYTIGDPPARNFWVTWVKQGVGAVVGSAAPDTSLSPGSPITQAWSPSLNAYIPVQANQEQGLVVRGTCPDPGTYIATVIIED